MFVQAINCKVQKKNEITEMENANRCVQGDPSVR